MHKCIGERFREERERRGYTQEALGAEIGKDRTTLRNWEGGKGTPTTAVLLTLHNLGLDVFYILTGNRSPIGVGLGKLDHMTPASQLAAEIAALTLTDADTTLLLALARHLATSQKKALTMYVSRWL